MDSNLSINESAKKPALMSEIWRRVMTGFFTFTGVVKSKGDLPHINTN